MKLTIKQKEAVHAIEGNVLVHAGAGSGKTSVFTARIANLIGNEGVSPDKVLGLTFTNEASGNMKDRLGVLIGKNKAKNVNLMTFHSFAYRLLKSKYAGEYAHKTIMKHWWKQQQLYDIIGKRRSGNSVGLNLNCKVGDLGSFISFQKSNMVREGMQIIWKEEFSEYGTENEMQKAFDTYCQLVRNARLIDFDDMLVDLYYKLLEDSALLADLKSTYSYVMVDEFQDTNTVSLEILKLVTDNNLFVVGDFRQGIYGFINANISNILNFEDMFEDVRLIELEDNFRSTDNIVKFANTVIDKAPIEKYKRFSEQVASRGEVGSQVRVSIYSDETEEAESIIRAIKDEHVLGMPYESFAILSRTNAQLGFYESLFAEHEIPADVSSSKSFFDRREIDDILSYAEHTIRPNDDMSMRRIINSPSRFVSKNTVNQIDEFAYNNGINFEEACAKMDTGRSRANIGRLLSLFESLRNKEEGMNASDFLKLVFTKTRYKEHIEKTSATASDLAMKMDSVERLFGIARKFKDINSFLGHVSVIKNNSSSNKKGVRLMTVHASKGLEFDYVFLPTITEENFPHDMNNDVEEERRLLYVASSRAKNVMDISLPVFDNNGSDTILPSPFLEDVMGESLALARKEVLRSGGTKEISFV